jgi:hypothetical protein
LLITAAFDVGETPHVKLRDTRQRVLHHMEGLLAWLESSDFRQIVFAKNCGTKIPASVLCETAAAFGKELEFLEIPSSKLTARQGKARQGKARVLAREKLFAVRLSAVGSWEKLHTLQNPPANCFSRTTSFSLPTRGGRGASGVRLPIAASHPLGIAL